MAEYLDLFDRDRRPLNRVHLRGIPIPENCFYQAVQIWIGNDEGRFLISKRHPDRPLPLLWETAGGCVSAGESSLRGAVRELSEELGIVLPEEKFHLLRTVFTEEIHQFKDVYFVRWNGTTEALRLQEAEVVDARWADFAEILQLKREERFVPGTGYFEEEFPGGRFPDRA